MDISKMFDQALGSPIVMNSTIPCVDEASTSVNDNDSTVTAVLGRQHMYTYKLTLEATPVKASARIQRQHGNKNKERHSLASLDDLSSMFGGLALTTDTIRSTPFKNEKASPKKKKKPSPKTRPSTKQITTPQAFEEPSDLGHFWREVDGTRIRKSSRLAK